MTKTQKRAGLLTFNHIGSTVTVSHGATTITGMLASVTHECDLIAEPPRMMDRSSVTTYIPGRSKTVVRIAPDLRLELAPDSLVEVAE